MDIEKVGSGHFLGVFSSAPSGTNGDVYINSTDDKMYMYYLASWVELHTLTEAPTEFLLLETGDTLLLETGDKLGLE